MKTLMAACAAFTMLATAAFADAPATSNAVFVGGTPIMRVRVAAGGYSPEERAAQIQERVNKLLGQGPIHVTDITIAPQGGDYVVLVKGQLLFTADIATARFNQSTTRELAEKWSDSMRQVLPGLTSPH